MRKLRISITDENGVLLDTGTIKVTDLRRKVSVVALDSDEEMAVSDLELLIGAPERKEVEPCRPSSRAKCS